MITNSLDNAIEHLGLNPCGFNLELLLATRYIKGSEEYFKLLDKLESYS